MSFGVSGLLADTGCRLVLRNVESGDDLLLPLRRGGEFLLMLEWLIELFR